MYLVLKTIHVGTVAVSGALFVFRYFLLQFRPNRPLPKLLRILPHANDAILLAAAIALMVHVGLNPISTTWLGAKIVAVVVYIILGMICFRLPVRSLRQFSSFVLAVATFSWIVFAATYKQGFPF